MNPDLLPANLSLVFLAAAGAALLTHLGRLTKGERLSPAIDAACAAGLIYLFGIGAFGWSCLPREALFAFYAALFSLLAATAILRRLRSGAGGAPLAPPLIQTAAILYIFAPAGHWKPPLSALLAIYFLFSAVSWMIGSPPEDVASDDPRPPLIPPKRLRGAREFGGAALAAALVFVFVMGAGKPTPPPAPKAPEPVAQAEPEPEAPAAAAEEAKAEEDPAPARTYRAAAGETLRSIARKLYGKVDKWRALAAANPGLKPNAKLKAGQEILLPPEAK